MLKESKDRIRFNNMALMLTEDSEEPTVRRINAAVCSLTSVEAIIAPSHSIEVLSREDLAEIHEEVRCCC